jgi:hypothetical protein
MKPYIHWLSSLLLVAALAGCASPNFYQASGANNRLYGYAERQVDGPLFRVSYIASPVAEFDEIYSYTLFRAAEVAKDKGATHFEVLEGGVHKDAVERFINKVAKTSKYYDPKNLEILNLATGRIEPPLSAMGLPTLRTATTYVSTPIYIYVPVQPPPQPTQISLLIRLLNAPSLDPARGFDVNDLLIRITPKIQRPPPAKA